MSQAIAASGSELVTVALRRLDPAGTLAGRGSLIDVLADAGVELLPNTAGCHTARDALITARLAREAFATDWIKLEVIGDEDTSCQMRPSSCAPPRCWSMRASSCCPIPPMIPCSRAASSTSGAPP